MFVADEITRDRRFPGLSFLDGELFGRLLPLDVKVVGRDGSFESAVLLALAVVIEPDSVCYDDIAQCDLATTSGADSAHRNYAGPPHDYRRFGGRCCCRRAHRARLDDRDNERFA